MIRQRQLAARRAQAGRASAREISIPLPLRGLFADAKSSEVSGLFAATLHNFRSDGISIQSRPATIWSGPKTTAFQRVPFEFGDVCDTIAIHPTYAAIAGAVFTRQFPRRVQVAYLSSNALIVDGAGPLVRFDGEVFSSGGFYCADDAVNPDQFDGIIAYNDRPFLWRTGGTLEFWYGDVGAVNGELTRFPLDRLGNITGSIAAMTVLTLDSQSGLNDVLCITTTTGQIVTYQGLDPGDADNWSIIGRVQAACPISRDAFAQVGSDTWMVTPRGVISVRESLSSSVLALRSDMSRPVADELSRMVAEGGSWQTFVAPDGSMIILNRVLKGTARQIIYYLDGKAWATADMPVRDFCALNGEIACTGFDGRKGTLAEHGDEDITHTFVSSWFRLRSGAEVRWVKPVLRAVPPSRFWLRQGVLDSGGVWLDGVAFPAPENLPDLVERPYAEVSVAVLADHCDAQDDITAATQDAVLFPASDNETGEVTVSEILAADATGAVFQLRLDITARWLKLIQIDAGVA